MPTRLGIVAGGGALPGFIARTCRDRGREVFIVALEHQADPEVVSPWPHAWVRMGAAGTAIGHLREAGVEDVVLAGPVRRPSLAELRPDGRALRFLARGVLAKGDDGLLSAVARALEEEEGFHIVSVQDIVGGILAPAGSFGRLAPTEADLADIGRGRAVLVALGAVDVGQAVVVQAGVVLGIEAIEGTDSLIVRCGALRREGKAPVLVKLAKTSQDRRIDLPTIGAMTVELCRDAGFAGIAVEAGGCIVVDRETTAARADAAGLFIVGVPAQGH